MVDRKDNLGVSTFAVADGVMQVRDVAGEISSHFSEVCAAQMDEGIRAKLVEIGWTPPGFSQWRRIENAPKDGTRVLVYDPTWNNGIVSIARWWEGYFRVGDLPGVETYPTHWMPLPESPED